MLYKLTVSVRRKGAHMLVTGGLLISVFWMCLLMVSDSIFFQRTSAKSEIRKSSYFPKSHFPPSNRSKNPTESELFQRELNLSETRYQALQRSQNPNQNGIFNPVLFQCPHSEDRLGKQCGKWICGLNLYENRTLPCAIYTFGDNDKNGQLITDLRRRTVCDLFVFETKNYRKFPYGHHLHVHSRERIGWHKGTSLANIMQKYNHRFVDILVVEIRGREMNVMEQIMDEFGENVLPFGQLLIEIDVPKDRIFSQLFRSWFAQLESSGLRPFHLEAELDKSCISGPSTRNLDAVAVEYSFINLKAFITLNRRIDRDTVIV